MILGQAMLEMTLYFPTLMLISGCIFLLAGNHFRKTISITDAVLSARRGLSHLAPHPLQPRNVGNSWCKKGARQKAVGVSRGADGAYSHFSIFWSDL